MCNCYRYGRLAIELNGLSLESLQMIVEHSPDGDSWMHGESLDLIIERMSILSNRDINDIQIEVNEILEEKHKKELLYLETRCPIESDPRYQNNLFY